MSYTFLSVVLSIVWLKGVASLGGDLVKASALLFCRKYKDVGVQMSESSMRFHETIYFNPNNQNCHYPGSPHVGRIAETRQVCKICYTYL